MAKSKKAAPARGRGEALKRPKRIRKDARRIDLGLESDLYALDGLDALLIRTGLRLVALGELTAEEKERLKLLLQVFEAKP